MSTFIRYRVVIRAEVVIAAQPGETPSLVLAEALNKRIGEAFVGACRQVNAACADPTINVEPYRDVSQA